MLKKILQKQQGGRYCTPNSSWCIHLYAELGLWFGSPLSPLSFNGNSVRKTFRVLSCLFTVCSPAKRNAKHEKVFAVVFFPSGKQVSCSQTRAKPAGIHSQVKGVSDSVAEINLISARFILLLFLVLQYLLTASHTQRGLFSPFLLLLS